SDVRHLHSLCRSGQERPQLRVAVVTALPAGPHDAAEVVIAGSGAKRRAKIDSLGSKQAGEQAAVDTKPCPGAVAAERAAHRHDQANLAVTVGDRKSVV